MYAGQLAQQEAVGSAGALDIQPDDRGQHDETAGQGEEQELDGGILPTRPAELPDEEVDRDEHRLEEDVEQEHVGRGEHTDHERLEDEHEGEVVALTMRFLGRQVVPGGQQAHRDEDHRHEDERQGDSVDTEGVADPELRDPRVLFDELELARARRRELQRSRDGKDEGHQRRAERDVLGPVGQRGRQQPQDHGPDKRDQADDGQPGELVHHCTTQTAPRITTTPMSIVRA